MAVGLILTFAGQGRANYDAVSAKLGIDPTSPNSDWPAGLQSHAAGTRDDGSLVVMEVWDSREAQGRFMQERLGPAVEAAGATGTPEMTWVELFTHTAPQNAPAKA
jgi:hypothetical protein